MLSRPKECYKHEPLGYETAQLVDTDTQQTKSEARSPASRKEKQAECERTAKGRRGIPALCWQLPALPPYRLVSLTILAAGPIQLDDMWMVDLFQKVELREQIS